MSSFSPPPPPNNQPNPIDRLMNSQFTRLFVIGFLILILQIPTFSLFGIISERQALRQTAIQDVTSKWGKEQIVVGPRLLVPYIKRIGGDKPGDKIKELQKIATFLPEDLQINGTMATETRYRGLFQVPVYTTKLDLSGKFDPADFSPWGVKPEDVMWDKSELVVQISDTRAISDQVNLKWNNAKLAFNPGLGKLYSGEPSLTATTEPAAVVSDGTGRLYSNSPAGLSSNTGIHVRLAKQIAEKQAYSFSIPLELRGSEKLNFVPMGKLTQVALTSNWANPSFQGAWLPEKPTVKPTGFEAKWQIPFLGRNFPQQWIDESPVTDSTIYQTRFGVDLFSPVDNYHMAERSIKYNFLFIILTFAVLWLFETTVRLRVHPLQYLMVGVAMCLFYLLELALSEHLGFHQAYVVASLAIVVLITSYTMSVLRAKRRGGMVGVMQVCLYSYLYVVLASQDYSLLLGSVGLFVFLAGVMFATRRVDWFNTGDALRPTLSGGGVIEQPNAAED
jgi:inner membrane protein